MVNNVKVPYIFKERRKGDVQCLIADNSYAHSVLGWSPKKNIDEFNANFIGFLQKEISFSLIRLISIINIYNLF